MALLNLVKMTVLNTPGTTDVFNLGVAVAPYQTFVQAGAVDGASYSYVAVDGTKFECGHGTYNAATNSLSRDTIYDSSAGQGVAENMSINAQVYVTPLKQDMPDLPTILATCIGMSLLF